MYLLSLLILVIAVSLDSVLYGMIYERCSVKVKNISLLLFSLSGWVTLIIFGIIGKLLVILLPIILAKVIAITFLLIFSLVILKDIITYNKGTLKITSVKEEYYILDDNPKYDNFLKSIYYPIVSENLRDMKVLEGLTLGVIINLDGGVVMLALGIIKGRIIFLSLIFILAGLISYKLGNILVKKDFINKLK
ncbi:hypothetical protein BX659_11184 [Orenia metallireducens]|jgi:putative Mn2+ efflux pump MntP|uniref:Sporulation protein YtaF n=1 Tax=Orenia metallireducens TaxID=1413210 RepID=A0A285HAT2_9FIRM|nr:hypothetical protein [Orenia metallireducens]PRX28965.1 hypothetical protein BX659_11184 [Orenia metallireducens]SNY32848.1 hypothetical protein SAMN06265827_11684 [Orenia metallireducens]